MLLFGHPEFVLGNKMYFRKSCDMRETFFSSYAKITKWRPYLNIFEEFDFPIPLDGSTFLLTTVTLSVLPEIVKEEKSLWFNIAFTEQLKYFFY